MDLPIITKEKIFEVLTKEWQAITSLISNLKIKDLMTARSLQITLKNLELQKKVTSRIINGKKHWKFCDELIKTYDNVSQSEKINEEIGILTGELDLINKVENVVKKEKIDHIIMMLKEKLEFYNKLEDMIENSSTGYELNYDIEQFRRYLKNKERRFEEQMWKQIDLEGIDPDKIYDKLNGLDYDLHGYYPNNRQLIMIGNNKIRKMRENEDRKKEYEKIKFILDRGKEFSLKNIGYLEFLKQGPKQEYVEEEDLDDFIDFLDEKFKEWEELRSRKKD